MSETIIHGRSKGFFERFTRRPGNNQTNMHYCPGCGHGILHKLIAEALEERGIQDRTILISPVGCSVFAFHYFDCFGISVPHGRAPAVGTGLVRSDPDHIVISYQGDGDLGAIGLNELIHCANRGENMTVFFVNNAIYGMTGGQMAPTTLPGQKTMTSPTGRSTAEDGYPLRIAELVNGLTAPVYVERVALSTGAKIMQARAAVRKAIDNTIARRGFSLVEFLSGCPINLKLDAAGMNEYIDTRMAEAFPLGRLRDRVPETEVPRHIPEYDPEAVKQMLYPARNLSSVAGDFRNPSPFFHKERRLKIAGSGGQGVLSFGYMLATMAKLRNFQVSYLPAYGPEMRGGTANCSVVFSRERIASPLVDSECNLLIAFNQQSLEKFMPELKPTGVVLFDSSLVTLKKLGKKQVAYCVDATELAREMGNLQYANSIMLGAIGHLMEERFLQDDDKKDFPKVVEEGISECFQHKPQVIPANIEAYKLGKTKARRWRPQQ